MRKVFEAPFSKTVGIIYAEVASAKAYASHGAKLQTAVALLSSCSDLCACPDCSYASYIGPETCLKCKLPGCCQ